MNSTSNSDDGSNPNLGVGPLGSIGLVLGLLAIVVIITYGLYMYKRVQSRSSTGDNTNHDFSIVTIQHNGLDEATLYSYPQLTYSQLKLHKGDSTSACSICRVDYDDNDLLRLLPDCGHLFHLKCIDPWLILHPTCPVCRNSPLPTPLAPAASVPT